MWSELYNSNNKPTFENVSDFINSTLWNELCLFVENTYSISPKLEFSKCSMQKGWNIKYKKGSKSLCTLYPMDGYFIVLIVIGKKELAEANIVIPTCSIYTQNLFLVTPSYSFGKWLMIEVREKSTFEDVKKLVKLRVKKSVYFIFLKYTLLFW